MHYVRFGPHRCERRGAAMFWKVQLTLAALLVVHLCEAQTSAKNLTEPPARVSAKEASDLSYRKLASVGPLVAFSVTVPPHGSTLIQAHPHDYLLVALKKADLSLSGPYGNTFQLHLGEGEMQVVNGGWAHRVSNLDDTVAVLVEVDVKGGIRPQDARCGLSGSECTDGRFGRTDEGTYSRSTLFETSTVRLTKIALGPGGVLEGHTHSGPEVLIPLSSTHFENDDGSITPSRLDVDVGDVHSFPAGTVHRLKNIGSELAQFLEFERK